MAQNVQFVKTLVLVFGLFLYVQALEDKLCDDVVLITLQETEPVETKYGKIVGHIVNSRERYLSNPQFSYYSSFKGIRYAQPPTGKYRFSPPVPVKPWTNIYEAFKDGNKCPQLKNFVSGDYEGDDDCLFLNVYTPETDFSFNTNKTIANPKKAVMVWIHGGAFFFGTGNSDLYGPDFLVRKDVVLVTMNYRLGAPGFLNLNTPSVPGNAGLKDQALALKWVKENIEKFGGDSDRITIFGQSAGGASVDLHSISDTSKHLFARAISLSGSIFCSWAFTTKPEEQATNLQNSMPGPCKNRQCNTTMLEKYFQEKDIRLLTETNGLLVNITTITMPFVPSVEGNSSDNKFLDECYLSKIQKGDAFHGEYIFGHTNLETNFVGRIIEQIESELRPSNVMLKIVPKVVEKVVPKGIIDRTPKFLKDTFKDMYNYWSGSMKKVENYVVTKTKKIVDVLQMNKLSKWLQEQDFFIHRSSFEFFEKPIDLKRRYLQKYGNANSSLFFYLFEYEEQSRTLMHGAAHSDDLHYLFYKENSSQICTEDSSDKDVIFRRNFLDLLTNFAKTGTPTNKRTNWPDCKLRNEFLKITKEGDFQIKTGRSLWDQWRKIVFNLNFFDKIDDAKCEQVVTIPLITEFMKITIRNLHAIFNEDILRPVHKYLVSGVGLFAPFVNL